MTLSLRSILMEALRDARRTWPQLLLTDLLLRVNAMVVLVPLVGLVLQGFLRGSRSGPVTDAAIVDFLIHPLGILTLLTVGAIALGLVLAENGAIMVIGFGAAEDREVTWLAAFRYGFRRVAALVRLAWIAVGRVLLIAIPFLVGIGVLYLALLQEYDINYYLVQKPPRFQFAVIGAGVLLTTMAVLVVRRLAGWMLALPLVLFEGTGGREALRDSEQATADYRRSIALGLVAWVGARLFVAAAVTFVIGGLADMLIPSETASVASLVVGLGAVLAVSTVANLAVTIFTAVLFPLVVLRLYRNIAGPGALRPDIAARGSLAEKASMRIPGKPLLWASAVVILLFGGGAYFVQRNLDWNDDVEIIAHRGGPWEAPENTMAAFQRALADSADFIELDVQENADGVVVVQHDRDLMRAAGTNLEIWRATNADLAEVDIGSAFGPEFSDQRVPTLREVLLFAKDRAGLFIELKYYGHDEALETKVVDLVEETGMESNVVIMSLEYAGVRKAAALRTAWTYGLLNAVSIGDLTRLDVDFLALSARAATTTTIRAAQSRGMMVYAWTINDPVQMFVMMSRGVDGIITDRVELSRQVRDIRAGMAPMLRLLVWLAGEAGLLPGTDETSSRDNA
jgi:glycerophosphoryl diester phosphodiesterase